MNTRAFIRYWGPVLLLVAIIFWASSDAHSGTRLSRVLHPLIQWLAPQTTPQTLHRVTLGVRKAAHLAEYAALAALLWRALVHSSPHCRPGSGTRAAWQTLALVLLFAVSDEWHQTSVPSRHGTPWDVLVDLAGALTALWLVGAFRPRPAQQPPPVAAPPKEP